MDFAAGVRFTRDSGDGASCVQWHGPDDTPPHKGARRSHTSRLLKAIPPAERMLL